MGLAALWPLMGAKAGDTAKLRVKLPVYSPEAGDCVTAHSNLRHIGWEQWHSELQHPYLSTGSSPGYSVSNPVSC